MKLPQIIIYSFLLLGILSGEIAQRPSIIEAEVTKSGRYACSDINCDGWDDLWVHLFPEVNLTRPGADEDHDGKSNYEEMLDFEDPFHQRKAARELSATEVLEVRKKSSEARRDSDLQKRFRFQALLVSRGAMEKRSEPARAAPLPKDKSNLELQEESSLRNHPSWDSLMLCSVRPPVKPNIVGMERLSNGQVLLAWEGEQDRLFNVEYSDDLVNWKSVAQHLSVINGIGTWGQLSTVPRRFYRIESSEVVSELIGDPTGGNGVTTFGGLVSVNASGTYFTASVNLPAGIQPSTVELFIDGEFVGYCSGPQSSSNGPPAVTGTSGNYDFSISGERLSVGPHTAYARIDASSGSTPGPDNQAAIVTNLLRTPEMAFNALGGYLTGSGVSEDHILSDEPDSPTSTTVYVEYPYLINNDVPMSDIQYILSVFDDDRNLVRKIYGIEQGPGPGQIECEWDGRGENGATLPDGPYDLSISLIVPGDLTVYDQILVKKGPAKFKLLALAETLVGLANTPASYASYRPEWWDSIGSSGGVANTPSGWGPWLRRIQTVSEYLGVELFSLVGCIV